MHEMAAHLPHEELLQALTLSAILFESQYHVPSYGERYENYTDHKPLRTRTLLQLRQWLAGSEHGGSRRRVWAQVPHAHGIQRRFAPCVPRGFTVRLHRDPTQVILSLSTMLVYIQALQSDRPKPQQVFEYWTARIERILRKSIADDAMLGRTAA